MTDREKLLIDISRFKCKYKKAPSFILVALEVYARMTHEYLEDAPEQLGAPVIPVFGIWPWKLVGDEEIELAQKEEHEKHMLELSKWFTDEMTVDKIMKLEEGNDWFNKEEQCPTK